MDRISMEWGTLKRKTLEIRDLEKNIDGFIIEYE